MVVQIAFLKIMKAPYKNNPLKQENCISKSALEFFKNDVTMSQCPKGKKIQAMEHKK